MSNSGPSYVPPLDPLFANPLDSSVGQAFDLSFMTELYPSLAPALNPSSQRLEPDAWDLFDELFDKGTNTEAAPLFPEALARPVVPLFSATSQPTAIEPFPVNPALTTASTTNGSNQPELHGPQSPANTRATSYSSLQPQTNESLQSGQSNSKKEKSKEAKHGKIRQEIENIDEQLEALRKDTTYAKQAEKTELLNYLAEHYLTVPPHADDKSKVAKTARSEIKKIKNKFSARVSRIEKKIYDLQRDKLLQQKNLEILILQQQVKDLQRENEQLRALQGDPAASQQSAILWQSASSRAISAPEITSATTSSKGPKLK